MKRLITLVAAVIIGFAASFATVVIVDGTHVRLRTGPSTSYSIVTDAYNRPIYPPKGAKLNYLGTAGNFYKVEYCGYVAYISRDFAHLKDYNQSRRPSNNNYNYNSSRTVVVVDGRGVRLRLGPSLNARLLTNQYNQPIYPAKGSTLTYLGTEGNFYRVNYQGYSVYISRDYTHLKKY